MPCAVKVLRANAVLANAMQADGSYKCRCRIPSVGWDFSCIHKTKLGSRKEAAHRTVMYISGCTESEEEASRAGGMKYNRAIRR